MATRPILEPVYPDAIRPSVFQDGLEFQDFVCELLAKQGIILQNLTSKKWQVKLGENLQGFEIKYDSRCSETGRLSIEVAEKSRASQELAWTRSGIMRSDNSWLYIQGNYAILFLFAKRFLLNYYYAINPELTDKFGTIRTFYLPIQAARKHAARVIDLSSGRAPAYGVGA